jgi:hypothetical protein
MDSNPCTNVEHLYGAHFYNVRLWIPAKADLRKIISQIEHDCEVPSHMVQDTTIELIKVNFIWPRKDKYSKDFVRRCEFFKCTKAPRHAWYGLLFLQEAAYASWQSITIDFIVDLTMLNGYTQI